MNFTATGGETKVLQNLWAGSINQLLIVRHRIEPSLDKNGTSVAHVDTVLLGRKDTAAAEVVDNLLLSIFGQGGQPS